MAKRNNLRPIDEWALRLWEATKHEPRIPSREVFAKYGIDLDRVLDEIRTKRSRRIARRNQDDRPRARKAN